LRAVDKVVPYHSPRRDTGLHLKSRASPRMDVDALLPHVRHAVALLGLSVSGVISSNGWRGLPRSSPTGAFQIRLHLLANVQGTIYANIAGYRGSISWVDAQRFRFSHWRPRIVLN
jgi:hypothetical protein